MFTTAFWKATAERAIKTFAQGLLAATGIGVTGLFDVAWTSALSFAGLAAVVSVLTSLASGKISGSGGPSLGGLEILKKLYGLHATAVNDHENPVNWCFAPHAVVANP